jgi:hypothetical protein
VPGSDNGLPVCGVERFVVNTPNPGRGDASMYGARALPWLLLLYGAASLLHFAHNAEFLADYPNLPPGLSRSEVYLAWCAITAAGLAGYVLYRRGRELIGLAVLIAYAVVGFDGLLHYGRAPLHAHTPTMNFTILSEVVAATLLLIALVQIAAETLRRRSE